MATLDAEHLDLVPDLELLGRVMLGQLKVREAEEYYRRALAIVEKHSGPEDLSVLPHLHNLIRVCVLTTERKPEAEAVWERVIRLREKQQGPDHDDIAGDIVRLAKLRTGMQKYKEAEAGYWRALLMLERLHGRDHAVLPAVLEALADMLADTKRFHEAEYHLRRSIAIREAVGVRSARTWRSRSTGSAMLCFSRSATSMPNRRTRGR